MSVCVRGRGRASIKLAKCAWMVCASAGAPSPRLRAAGPERCRRVRRCAAARARSNRGAPSSQPVRAPPGSEKDSVAHVVRADMAALGDAKQISGSRPPGKHAPAEY